VHLPRDVRPARARNDMGTVLVSGAGPAVAYWLRRYRFTVTVVE